MGAGQQHLLAALVTAWEPGVDEEKKLTELGWTRMQLALTAISWQRRLHSWCMHQRKKLMCVTDQKTAACILTTACAIVCLGYVRGVPG